MDLDAIRTRAIEEIGNARDARALEAARIAYLGRKGPITDILQSLKDLPLEKRRVLGPKAQGLRRELEALLEKRLSSFTQQTRRSVDVTAPGKRPERGHLHPLTRVEEEIRKIFLGMNFSVVEGPEVESEYYNFDALNLPPNHPARDMWDTFWVKQKPGLDSKKRLLLRTHTSPVQVRYMEAHEPPFQIIVPGRVSRYEATDATHEVHFVNLEGLMVGKSITLANFKFVIEEFFRKFFSGKKIEFRYRPSYFPFVEPGLEVDVKHGGRWLEMMGAGMVHPRVFEYAHYNPNDWRGFAFGMGVDRLAMVKYQIPDIRLFYSGDLRVTKQF